MNVPSQFRWIGVSLLVFALYSCVTTAPLDYKSVKIDVKGFADPATLGTGDVFEVRVHQHADLSGIYRVSSAGMIDFPFVGQVAVSGHTPAEIETVIRTQLANGYLKNPSVVVYVKERNSKKVYVLGQVKKPGTFIYEEKMTIVQAIALAGGFTPMARTNYAIVQRVDKGVEKRIPVPVERIMTEKATQNFSLMPGDIVFVPEAVL